MLWNQNSCQYIWTLSSASSVQGWQPHTTPRQFINLSHCRNETTQSLNWLSWVLIKYISTFHSWLKSDKNNRHFTWWPAFSSSCTSSVTHQLSGQKCFQQKLWRKMKHLSVFYHELNRKHSNITWHLLHNLPNVYGSHVKERCKFCGRVLGRHWNPHHGFQSTWLNFNFLIWVLFSFKVLTTVLSYQQNTYLVNGDIFLMW